jgi:membrane protein implicated in regulation of membrane protease activity
VQVVLLVATQDKSWRVAKEVLQVCAGCSQASLVGCQGTVEPRVHGWGGVATQDKSWRLAREVLQVRVQGCARSFVNNFSVAEGCISA